uniref:Neprosin PEP catalytic domain-containing protein n=1 Tax=Leersia perrieri TaxID=77586 RepID=A0A0D9WT85_9ORYZ
MATILFIGVFLSCFVLLSSATRNGSQDRCGAMGQTTLCKKLTNGSNWGQQLDYITYSNRIYQNTGYATKTAEYGHYGFIATMDVYGFLLSPGQLSSYGSVWIITGEAGSVGEAIQIGWRVKQGDERPAFYLGCVGPSYPLTDPSHIDVECPGFQPHIDARTRPGDPIPDISQPNGAKQYITVKVFKDKATGAWLLHYGFNKDPEIIGRIPNSPCPISHAYLTQPPTSGMAVTDQTFKPTPPQPPMGSGYKPVGNGSMAASMRNIQFIDEQGRAWPAGKDLVGFSICENHAYAFSHIDDQFFYGGPFSAAMSRTHAIYSYLLVLLFVYYVFA